MCQDLVKHFTKNLTQATSDATPFRGLTNKKGLGHFVYRTLHKKAVDLLSTVA